MRLRYSGPAVNDFARLKERIAEYNPKSAQRIARRIKQYAAQLKAFPLLGVCVDDRPDIRDLIIDDYVIRYQVDAENKIIRVLRVWHGKENLR